MRGLSLVAASGGHSSSQCAGLSLSRPLLLRSTGSRRAGSVIVAHGPSCSAACGILPDQGLNPCPLHWQADSQPLRHQGSPLDFFCSWVLFPSQWLLVCTLKCLLGDCALARCLSPGGWRISKLLYFSHFLPNLLYVHLTTEKSYRHMSDPATPGVQIQTTDICTRIQRSMERTPLVAQWLRIHLPVQGTRAGKIPHAAEQQSPCTTTTEPAL